MFAPFFFGDECCGPDHNKRGSMWYLNPFLH